jgi:hypothetical protein
MNKILVISLSIVLCLLGSSSAMIGQSEAEMIKEYGSPSDITSEGFKVYLKGHLEIHAHFSDGISDNTVYIADPNVTFDDHTVSGLLCVESSGLAWIVDENSTPDRIMYSTPNRKYHAILLSRSKLSVFTDSFLQKRKRETGA